MAFASHGRARQGAMNMAAAKAQTTEAFESISTAGNKALKDSFEKVSLG